MYQTLLRPHLVCRPASPGNSLPELHPISHTSLMLQGSCDSTVGSADLEAQGVTVTGRSLCGPAPLSGPQADSPGPLLPASPVAPSIDQHCTMEWTSLLPFHSPVPLLIPGITVPNRPPAREPQLRLCLLEGANFSSQTPGNLIFYFKLSELR